MRILYSIFFGLVLLTLFQSCAPVFSEMQSARTLGKGVVEVLPTYSAVNYTKNDKTTEIQEHVGGQVSVGMDANTDLRIRYEYIWLDGYDFSGGTSVLGIGPKFGIVKNRIAFSATIGTSFSEDDDNWQLHPTLLLTQPLMKDLLDVTLSSKYLIVICKDCENLVAFNLGLSIGNNISRWSIRPEYGILFNPTVSGMYHQFSIGAGMTFGK